MYKNVFILYSFYTCAIKPFRYIGDTQTNITKNPHINSWPPPKPSLLGKTVCLGPTGLQVRVLALEKRSTELHTLPARCSTSVHLSVHIIFVCARVCLMCANCTLKTRSHSNPLKSAGLTSTALRWRISLTIARWTVDTPLSPIPRAEAGSWKSRSVDWK